MMRFSISWLKFAWINAFFVTIASFEFFLFAYPKFSQYNFLLTCGMVAMFFSLANIIITLFFMRYFSKFFSILFIIISIFSVYFMQSYGIVINADMIRNVMHTDAREVRELIGVKFIILAIICIALCIFIARISIVYPPFKKHTIIKIANIMGSLLLFIAIFAPLTRVYVPFFLNYNQIRMYDVPFYQIYSFVRYLQKDVLPKPEFQVIADDAIRHNQDKKKILVFVVGETARAANYSLGGYIINDTNFYTKQTDMIYFRNFFSCGTATVISLPCMFSESNRDNFSISQYKENVLDILQKTGVDVSWFGNNYGYCQGVCARIAQTKDIAADYDIALLDELRTKLHNLKKQNIILLHLQGSHGPTYYKRYTNEFRRFTPTCDTNDLSTCDNQSIINTYDNTLLYTDYILYEIIKILQQYDDYEISLLYMSDHGESLGENGIYLHSMPYALAPQTQIHIPAMFWSNNQAYMKLALKHKDYKLSHDNVFSTLLGFFNIHTRVYNPKMDIFNETLENN